MTAKTERERERLSGRRYGVLDASSAVVRPRTGLCTGGLRPRATARCGDVGCVGENAAVLDDVVAAGVLVSAADGLDGVRRAASRRLHALIAQQGVSGTSRALGAFYRFVQRRGGVRDDLSLAVIAKEVRPLGRPFDVLCACDS